MPSLLQLHQASFGYDQRPVVENVDLAIDAGQFLCVAGPNGAGKTTLFRGILGLIPPLKGRVELNARAVGYVPQRERLDPLYPLSVAEVVHMGAYGRLSGLRTLRSAERELAAECLARVGMGHHVKRPFASLSGGQRQRVLIARALMARPELLLLDEPTSGVDAEAVERISAWLQELAGEGIGVLVVTHQLEVFRAITDGVLWVADGSVSLRSSQAGSTT